MQKDSTTLFDKDVPRVMVLTGNDAIGREKAREKILDQLYSRFNDLSEVKFDSTVAPFEVYLEQIITPSLFQNTRVFIIRHAQEISNDDLLKLEPMITSDLTDAYVLVEYEKRSGKRGRQKSVAQVLDIKKKVKKDPKKFVFYNFEKPPDYNCNPVVFRNYKKQTFSGPF